MSAFDVWRANQFIQAVAYAPPEVLDVEASTSSCAVVVHMQSHFGFARVLPHVDMWLIVAYRKATTRTDIADGSVVHGVHKMYTRVGSS